MRDRDRPLKNRVLAVAKAEARATGTRSVHADATVFEIALEFGLGIERAGHAREATPSTRTRAPSRRRGQRSTSRFYRARDVLAEPEQLLSYDLLKRRAAAHRVCGQVTARQLTATRAVEHTRPAFQEQRAPFFVVAASGRADAEQAERLALRQTRGRT